MKTTKVPWNAKRMLRLAKSETLKFNYPIQRKHGQWDALQKSLLIHSMASDYPVPPLLMLVDNKVEYVLDGKQRITNILDYISGVKDAETGEYPKNAYKLHKETPVVKFDESDEEFEMAGKYFDELHEDLQNEIASVNLSILRLENASDEEIEELFYRWNNGTPLTKQQKARAKMGTAHAVIFDELMNHDFIQEKASFTPLQRRRSDDEAVILQTMILFDENYELETFVSSKLLKYAEGLRDRDIEEVVKSVEEAMDYANMSLKEETTSLAIMKKLHLPTLLVIAKKAYDENVELSVFNAWVEDFNTALDGRTRDKALVKTGYKSFMDTGSVKKYKILGRKAEMIKHFEKFIKVYKPVIEDPFKDASVIQLKNAPENFNNTDENNDAEKEVAVTNPNEVTLGDAETGDLFANYGEGESDPFAKSEEEFVDTVDAENKEGESDNLQDEENPTNESEEESEEGVSTDETKDAESENDTETEQEELDLAFSANAELEENPEQSENESNDDENKEDKPESFEGMNGIM